MATSLFPISAFRSSEASNPIGLIQYLRNPKVCLTADGALQRFQVLVYPDMMPEQKLVDKYDE